MAILDVTSAGVGTVITRVWDTSSTGVMVRSSTVQDVTSTGVSTMVYPNLCNITSISPSSVVRNVGAIITITGTGLYSATKVHNITTGVDIPVTIDSDVQIRFTLPTTTIEGSQVFQVYNSRGGSNRVTITTTHPIFYLINPAQAGVWQEVAYGGGVIQNSGTTQIACYSSGYGESSWYTPYISLSAHNQIYLNASVTGITSSMITANRDAYLSNVTQLSPAYVFNQWQETGYRGTGYLRFGRYSNGQTGHSYLYQAMIRLTT